MAITFKSVLAAVRARLQTKTVAAGLTDETYYPDAGYDGFESFTVRFVGQDFANNRATPTENMQTVYPSSGLFFSEFIVEPIPSQYKIPYSITPSDSAPASMSSGTAYEPTAAGYAIQSYASASKTPSSSGTSFSAGWNRMTAAGYAYSSRPSGSLTATSLWRNSNTGTSFSDQTVTLSQSMANFSYIRIAFNVKTSSSENIWILIHRGDFQSCTGDDAGRFAMAGNASGTIYARYCRYVSATQIAFSTAYKVAASSHGTSAAYLIPVEISGVNVTAS